MPEVETTPGNGVTRRELYEALERQNTKIETMEQRIVAKLDDILKSGTPVLAQRVNRLEKEQAEIKKCDAEIEERIATLEKMIAGWSPYFKAAAFVGSALGLSIIALIWGILTHSVELVIP